MSDFIGFVLGYVGMIWLALAMIFERNIYVSVVGGVVVMIVIGFVFWGGKDE